MRRALTCSLAATVAANAAPLSDVAALLQVRADPDEALDSAMPRLVCDEDIGCRYEGLPPHSSPPAPTMFPQFNPADLMKALESLQASSKKAVPKLPDPSQIAKTLGNLLKTPQGQPLQGQPQEKSDLAQLLRAFGKPGQKPDLSQIAVAIGKALQPPTGALATAAQQPKMPDLSQIATILNGLKPLQGPQRQPQMPDLSRLASAFGKPAQLPDLSQIITAVGKAVQPGAQQHAQRQSQGPFDLGKLMGVLAPQASGADWLANALAGLHLPGQP